jgi:hypothetical protein
VRSELLTGPPLDDFSAVFGEYFVRARYEDEWDTILRALTGLWSEYPDFLLQILGRLSFRHSILANDDAPRRLQADAASERTARRERRGYIGASDAAAWLELARHAPLDDLVGARAYDALTERSLRALEAEAPAAGKPADDEPAMETDVTDADLDALQAALDAADIGPDTRAPRLTGPEPRGADAALRLALAALQQRSPHAFAARMRELAYLSNALVTAVRRNGARFDHESAANAAMATCNLGSEYLAIGSPTDGFDHVLTTEPGLVRAFSVGFSLIQRLPIAVAEGVAALFARNDVRDRLAPKRWVLDEVDSLLANGALADSVRARKLDDAKETISLLVIALKPEACVGLRVLVDELPALPRVLEQSERTAAVGESSRFIASVGDLARIERFLSGLADAVRL